MFEVKSTGKSVVLVFFISCLSIFLLLITPKNIEVLITGPLVMYISYSVILLYYKWPFKMNLIKFDFLNIKNICISLCCSIIILLINFIIIYLFSPTNNNGNETTQNIIKYNGSLKILITFIFPVILSPIYEEIIFRGIIGYIFDIFNRNKNYIYIIVNSFLFSILHLQTTGTMFSIITSMLFPYLSGVILSCLYIKFKNIKYSIITHSFLNFLIIAISVI